MSKQITIKEVKAIREQLGMTHLVIFAVDENNRQYVATHGKTAKQARESAKAGNNLKSALGWDKELCVTQPLERKCKNCFFFKVDWGVQCFNGWTGDGTKGYCHYEPTRIGKSADSTCHCFEPNN